MSNIIRPKAMEVRSADFVIKIYDYKDRIIKGSIEFSSTGESLDFCGLINMLDAIQDKLDEVAFPQATLAMRNWDLIDRSNPAGSSKEASLSQQPAHPRTDISFKVLASFILRIQFRQNAGWQGTLAWFESRRSMAFRSVLELTNLIDCALQYTNTKTQATPVARPAHKWEARESVS